MSLSSVGLEPEPGSSGSTLASNSLAFTMIKHICSGSIEIASSGTLISLRAMAASFRFPLSIKAQPEAGP